MKYTWGQKSGGGGQAVKAGLKSGGGGGYAPPAFPPYNMPELDMYWKQ